MDHPGSSPAQITAASQLQGSPARAVLEVERLKTYFFVRQGIVKAVDDISFSLAAGEKLAIVGESGCGKSMTALSILRLVPDPPGRIVGGHVRFGGKDLLQLPEAEMRKVRGNQISMIFQEPMTSLNPLLSIGRQIGEVFMFHEHLSRDTAFEKAVELLKLVKIPEAARRAAEYPHQLSGGMRQRAMTAMALACNPKVLLADEPTTALDVTIQAQILDLIVELQERLGTAVILITHDLGVVAETAQRVIVMYGGRKVEEAGVEDLFEHPRHPYTQGLLAAVPHLASMSAATSRRTRLTEIPGMVPALIDLPKGCTFAPRCAFATDLCHSEFPPYEAKAPGHMAACWHSDKVHGGADA
jgi:peptide/nickel transport system ATP-binding protein